MTRKIEDYILKSLIDIYGNKSKAVSMYDKSAVFQYLNLKSNAIHGNSKSRRSLAAWYSIYVIAKMYLENGFYNNKKSYIKFKGFKYTDVFNKQKSLYGGEKLQNHALNSRTNEEFRNKITHDNSKQLIIDNDGNYFLNPYYIYVDGIDITKAIVLISENYINLLIAKDNILHNIITELQNEKDNSKKLTIIENLIDEDSEARIFEIISYAILYSYFHKTKVFFGFSREDIKEEQLELYKTGRTNANDGGIDFVMKPLGRFFQVTEVDNYDKYLLDLDKILFYPMTFVVKTNRPSNTVKKELEDYIRDKFGGIEVVTNKYINAIEEVITINELKKWLSEVDSNGINEIIMNIDKYYKLEFGIIE